MLFAIGFIAMFMMGGLGGIMHASPPSDSQQQDTYFIVGHIHYVLIGGSIMALFSGLYYWFPKISGRMADDKLGKVSFWLIFFGLNFLAIPMHLVGLDGMPRRIYTYPENTGWDFLNQVATIGAFTVGLGILLTIHNLAKSARKGEKAGDDPWDARTLEWSISSPPPHYNFAKIPEVKALDDWWNTKHPELAHGGSAAAVDHASNGHEAHDEHGHEHIHMPNPSYWPFLAALGFLIAAYGFMFYMPMAIGGLLFAVFGVFGWTFEDVGPLEEFGITRIENRKMMMWAFLGSDCMFFGTLISTYLIYHGHSLEGPFPKDTFDIRLTSVSSFVLLMSSLLMVLAVSAIQAKKMQAFRIYTFLTAFFGVIFLGFQAYEFSHFVAHGLTLSKNLYGSTFFVLTGTHGCHVAIGVLWLLSLLFGSFKENGPVKPDYTGALTVEVAGLYWHFVDIVWIIIFTVVYLMEYIV
jgi:heme/copper-type cytochrome/quinol oxidase subunit 3